MGSFASTCSISGLPIEGGDPVRAFLITENPYDDNLYCGMSDLWFLRTLPVKAKYNDYGSIEDVEEGPLKDLWMEGLQIDLVARGVGDNSCHDVEVNKQMSFEQLLTALWEQRVHVLRDVGMSSESKPTLPDGVPTMKRIKKLLLDAKIKLSLGDYAPGLLVSNGPIGQVRVKDEKSKSDGKLLKKALKVIQDAGYPALITMSKGNYAFGQSEILVCTKPNIKDFQLYPRDKEKPLLVNLSMVREDVWNVLCEGEVGVYEKPYTLVKKDISFFKDKAFESVKYMQRNHLSVDQSLEEQIDSLHKSINGILSNSKSEPDFQFLCFHRDPVPFTVATSKHYDLLCKKELTDEQLRPITDLIAEQQFIAYYKLMNIRYYWKPSYSIGPQGGEWEAHRKFHQQMTKVCAKEIKARKARGW